MSKKRRKDHDSFKDSFAQFNSAMQDNLLLVKEWITDIGKVLLPLLLVILVFITVAISLNARDRVEQATEEAKSVLEEAKADVQEVKETVFEEDAYPDINKLIYRYYEALEMADIDILIDIHSNVTQTELLRLQKMCEYIDRYENIHVYTKPGPYIDTYIAYVMSDVFLVGQEESVPGLSAFYICKNDDGAYYINTSELSQEEALYIKNVTLQSDVVDLKNSARVSYNKAMENNPDLSEFWADLSVNLDLAVSEEMALEAKLKTQLEDEMNEDVSGNEENPEEVPTEPVVRRVKVLDRVNVRKSASQTADKIGSAGAGETYVLLEHMTNGWSKISYNSGEGYIKSEYLEEIEDVSKIQASGTVTVITASLNVRSEPSQTAQRIGALTNGQIVDLVEYVEGGEWCKIKFNDQIGYIKSEFVE
ncbi:MAG: SH3 domain-containing protein [Lachnospiraceae bacterium]|nr:SH3 domain-containing protein [Lachnospiraceae bacterium]MBR5993530.1 SH3 domain-containing protein [Lachnospiraceae bacterium]